MKKAYGRVILIVLDSVGVGEAPDAADFGDEGSHTLANTARAVGGLRVPHMASMGLGNLASISGVAPTSEAIGGFGRLTERSPGKDSTTGHWELAGLVLDEPFPTYPRGFPRSLITTFEQKIGRKVLGNRAASGTEIIADLGPDHVTTGQPIVYTSADSVFQIAAHIDVIPLGQLYSMCHTARSLLRGEHAVARVIARPFAGAPPSFYRTADRQDFSLAPPRPTLLDQLSEQGVHVHAIGKVTDLFAGQGITSSRATTDNAMGVDETVKAMRTLDGPALIFTNCVDFDVLYGHRNDPEGYARALEDFDARLPRIFEALQPRDVLLITADHGCDPTMPGTDHSRELVPLLAVGDTVQPGVDLGLRSTFADVAATIADYFSAAYSGAGESFAADLFR